MLPVYKSHIPKSSIEYANDAIRSSWISSIGKYVELATEKLKDVSDCEYAILANNGTSATHLVTRSLFRFHPEVKRVLVPSACYVAAYNSLLYEIKNNEIDIHCIDLNPNTWNMDVAEIEDGDAIFAVHNLGNIINVPDLKKRFGCVIIEDNCEGFFGSYNSVASGSQSLCSSLSFFGNKNITCGEGGAFLTNDKEVYDFALKLRGQGQTEQRYIHDELGYNYRMTNIQAAILLGQLENYDFMFDSKERVFNMYRNRLKNTEGIFLQESELNTKHSMWMLGVRFENLDSYETARNFFTDRGIDTRPMFYPYSRHKHLNFSGKETIATNLNNEIVVFPSYPELKDSEINYVCDAIEDFVNELRKP